MTIEFAALPPRPAGPAGRTAAPGHSNHAATNGGDATLRRAAQSLESSFLAQMLEVSGIGKTPETFGGGAGEDQFASFFRQEIADRMTEAGGIGLAQTIFESLKGTAHVR